MGAVTRHWERPLRLGSDVNEGLEDGDGGSHGVGRVLWSRQGEP